MTIEVAYFDAEVAALDAARARARALAMNRRGDFEGATRVLETTARRIEAVAGTNAVLRKLALDLRARMPDLARRMPALAMKAMHSDAYQALRSRDLTGKSARL